MGMASWVCGIRSVFGILVLPVFFCGGGGYAIRMSRFKGGFLLIAMYPWICVKVRLGLWMCEFH